MNEFDEGTLRDLMGRPDPQFTMAAGVGASISARQRRLQRRTTITRIAAGGVAAGTALGVGAVVVARGQSASPGSGDMASGGGGIQLTAAQETLHHLGAVSADAATPQGRYVTMKIASSSYGGVIDETSVWDSQTGEHTETQSGDLPQGAPTSSGVVASDPSLAQLAAMPTDPTALRAALLSAANREFAADQAQDRMLAHGHALPAVPAASFTDDEKVFGEAQELLYSPLVPQQLKSAIYTVLADIPGVVVNPDATDSQGRAADEISYTATTDGYTYAQSTYEDPATGAVLEQTSTATFVRRTQGQPTTTVHNTLTDTVTSVTSSDTPPAGFTG